LDNIFSPLASLNTTTLFNTPVIHLDIPSKILERFPVGFRCIQDIGSPMFWVLLRMNNPEHLDETVLAQVHNSPFWRDINLRNRAVMRVIRIN
jgi:hypothetical protein